MFLANTRTSDMQTKTLSRWINTPNVFGAECVLVKHAVAHDPLQQSYILLTISKPNICEVIVVSTKLIS